MKTLTPNSKNHVLKIFCSVLLLLAMLPGVLAQETVSDERSDIFDKKDMNQAKADPDKAASFRLNVAGSDALIYGLTVGRGGGSVNSNTALGVFGLVNNTTGTWNSAIGYQALNTNTTGSHNTAIGGWALRNNSTGTWNSAIGYLALNTNTTGYQNVAIGGAALRSNSTGSYNTACGDDALNRNTTGNRNTAFGDNALYYNTTGQGNTGSGAAVLFYNTTGSSNVAIGIRALFWNTIRSNLVAVGDSALFNNGRNATIASHAIQNTALGSKALYTNTTGSYNTATGFQALLSNTTGVRNTATGDQALYSNTTGFRNTATGNEALRSNTTGNWNTAYGAGALRDLTAGSENVAFGDNAGLTIASITRGTFVGSEAKPSATGFSNITGIGYAAIPTASNQVRIGNGSVTSIGGYAAWSNLSDERFKNNIEENVAGLDFILKLRPVTYNLEVDKLARHLNEDIAMDESDETAEKSFDSNMKARAEKSAIRYTGFLATEVEAAAKSIGYDFSGVDAPQNAESLYSLRYAEFVVPIVKAIQEQQQQIGTLSPEGIDALRDELGELRKANEQLLAAEVSLRAENENIRGQIKDILSMLETLGVEMQDCCQEQTTGRNPGKSSLNQMSDNPRLEQNTPNPFHENTLIRYFLPEGTHRAQIIITDMGGTQVMALPLEHQGAGQVMIHGGTLPSGTYVYTLTVDGRKVDSKRMVQL